METSVSIRIWSASRKPTAMKAIAFHPEGDLDRNGGSQGLQEKILSE
jgi:hypothetical protein